MYLHIDGLVPIDDISTKGKRLNVHHVYVALFGAHVEPLAAHRYMQVRYSAEQKPQTHSI